MDDERIITKTACVLIIGNEILSGKVRDINSDFLISELRSLGVSLQRVCIIPDDIRVIGEEVLFFSKHYDYVFTCGGIGPTHDDLTIEAISKSFRVPLKLDHSILEVLRKKYGDSFNNYVLKMALVPEGSELIYSEFDSLPTIFFKNIVILPGIPSLMKKKFLAIKERFRCSSFLYKKIFLTANESSIAESLTAISLKYPEVPIGSYPIVDNPEFKVIVSLESKSEEKLNLAMKELLSLIPENVIHKIE